MARGETKANGFAWNSKTKKCMGIEKAHVIDTKQPFWTSCIFTSKFLAMMKLYRIKILVIFHLKLLDISKWIL